MKKIYAAALAIITCAIIPANGAITISSTAPTLDGADQGNMVWVTSDSDLYWTDRPNPGQSFTTGSHSGGYSLSAFSFQLNSSRVVSTTFNYSFRVIATGGTTTLVNETGQTWNGLHSSGDWLTFTLTTPVTLAANTQYGVDFEHVSGGAWPDGIPSVRRNGNTFAGGSYYTRTDGDPSSISTNGSRDRIFHVDLVTVPEPSSLGLLGLGGLLLLFRRRHIEKE